MRARGPRDVQADLSIRGATFGQQLVLVDGVRLNDAQSGHHNSEFPVPLAALDRIVQGWHRDGWLIETEKKNGILPPSPALVEWHEAAKGTVKAGRS